MTAHEIIFCQALLHFLHALIRNNVALLRMHEQIAPVGFNVADAPQRHLEAAVVVGDDERRRFFSATLADETIELALEPRIAERLDDIIRGLILIALQRVLGEGREKDQANLGVAAAHLLSSRQSVDKRHANVEKDQVQRWVVLFDQRQPVVVSGQLQRFAAFSAVAVEQLAKMVHKSWFVVTDCNMDHGFFLSVVKITGLL